MVVLAEAIALEQAQREGLRVGFLVLAALPVVAERGQALADFNGGERSGLGRFTRGGFLRRGHEGRVAWTGKGMERVLILTGATGRPAGLAVFVRRGPHSELFS